MVDGMVNANVGKFVFNIERLSVSEGKWLLV
jgi:hypothetical protein